LGRVAVPLLPLVGRERELAAVTRLLARPEVRLVTLSGVGGVGKTRLALAAAERAGGAFADGAALVLLAAVRDPQLVASSIVTALGLRAAAERPAFEQLVGQVRERELLLVLDKSSCRGGPRANRAAWTGTGGEAAGHQPRAVARYRGV